MTSKTGEKAMATAKLTDKWALVKLTIQDLQQQDAIHQADEYLEYIQNLPEDQPIPIFKQTSDGYISLQEDGLELRREAFEINDPTKPNEPGWYKIVHTQKTRLTEILFWNGQKWYHDEEQNHTRFGVYSPAKELKVLDRIRTYFSNEERVLVSIRASKDSTRQVHLGGELGGGEENCYLNYDIQPETKEVEATVLSFNTGGTNSDEYYNVALTNGEYDCCVDAKWVRRAE
jgi:hypothetical protein